jgi:outer membrane cobalamin receptor
MNKIIMTLLAAFCSTIALAENVSDTAVFKNVSLDNVVVTGSRNQVDVRHLPFTVTPISRQQIEYRYTPSLLTVMNELVPGYFSTSRGIMGYGVSTGAAGGMTIRGIGGSPTTGMMVLIDGHPQYAGLMGHPIADAYQSFLAEKVEVLRGPASVLYGSNAMGGVVNIVTRRMLQNGVKTNARIGFGSFGTLTTEASNMTHFGRFSSIASLSYNRTDGHRTNSDFNQAGGYLKLAYLLTNNWTTMTDLNLTHFNASNPGTVANPMTDNDQHITRGVWSGGVENDYGWTSGAVKFYYNWGVHKINDGYGPSTNNNAPRNYLFHSRDHVWGINAYQSFILMEGNRTTFGIDYQGIGGRAWNDYDSGNTTNLVDTTEYEVAGYVDFRQNIGDILTFDAGARWDHHSQAGNEFIPQAGLVAHLPSQLEMKATVSKGFRNPTLQNLFMFRPKNPDLKAERVWNYEIAVSQHLIGDRLYWGANVYLLNGDNMIQVVAGRNENTGEIKNWGIELASNYRVNDHWFLNANYSFIHAKYDVVATPKHKLYGGADFSTGRWLLSTGVQWINHLTTQVTPITTASYVLWNARVTYKVLPWLNIYTIGENLLAQKYEVNYGYPMPRATMIGGVDISL